MNKNQNQNQNKNRSRGRNNNRRGGQQRGNNFESNGPEVKVRGTAQQVLDKYLQLARDAQSSGDRINAEGYLQYAEHYYRIINSDSNSGANSNQNSSHGHNNGYNNANNANDAGRYNSDAEQESHDSGTTENAQEESIDVVPNNGADQARQQQRNQRGSRPQRRNVAIEPADDGEPKSASPKPKREKKQETDKVEKIPTTVKRAKPVARRKPSSAATKERAPA